MLTGNKDVDRKILNNLEDKDLINICQVNKKARSLYDDQVFWMNRVFLRFGYVGGDVLRENKDKYWSSWSEYYIKDLRKINPRFTQLLSGSGQGRLDHVIISLKNGANNHVDESLISASRFGHLRVVKYLVGHGANIHTNTDEPMRWASRNGHIEVVRYLVGLGANIHTNTDELRWASRNGHIEVVRYLVGLGANIHTYNDYALRWASRNGHLGVVKYLVELKPDGANIHADDTAALGLASLNGQIEVVKYLVGVGANIHADDDYALRYARVNDHIEVVKYLESLS